MEGDKELKMIINQALPEVSCPVSNKNVLARRWWLEKKIIAYLDKKLSSNVKPVEAGN